MTFNVTRGDYAPLMQGLADGLAKAKVSCKEVVRVLFGKNSANTSSVLELRH